MDLSLLVPSTLALIMFSMGLSLQLQDFQRLLLQPRAALVGLSCQILLLPMTAYLIGLLLGLTDELLLGLVLLALCPGGVTSNLACKYAGGDIALSVSLTAMSSIITVFSLPLILNLAASYSGLAISGFSLPLLPTIKQLAMLTILPLGLAMVCQQYLPSLVSRSQRSILTLASSLFIVVIAMTWFTQWQSIKLSAQQIGFAVLALNLFSMLLGWSSARLFQLPADQRITLVLEVGLQNSVLAFTVAISLIGIGALAIPAAFYSVVMVCSALAVIYISQVTDNHEQ